MTLSELASKTETFLERVLEEKLKYSKIEDCIEKLRSEFGEELGSGVLFLEDAMVDSRVGAVDILIENFIKELKKNYD